MSETDCESSRDSLVVVDGISLIEELLSDEFESPVLDTVVVRPWWEDSCGLFAGLHGRRDGAIEFLAVVVAET